MRGHLSIESRTPSVVCQAVLKKPNTSSVSAKLTNPALSGGSKAWNVNKHSGIVYVQRMAFKTGVTHVEAVTRAIVTKPSTSVNCAGWDHHLRCVTKKARDLLVTVYPLSARSHASRLCASGEWRQGGEPGSTYPAWSKVERRAHAGEHLSLVFFYCLPSPPPIPVTEQADSKKETLRLLPKCMLQVRTQKTPHKITLHVWALMPGVMHRVQHCCDITASLNTTATTWPPLTTAHWEPVVHTPPLHNRIPFILMWTLLFIHPFLPSICAIGSHLSCRPCKTSIIFLYDGAPLPCELRDKPGPAYLTSRYLKGETWKCATRRAGKGGRKRRRRRRTEWGSGGRGLEGWGLKRNEIKRIAKT